MSDGSQQLISHWRMRGERLPCPARNPTLLPTCHFSLFLAKVSILPAVGPSFAFIPIYTHHVARSLHNDDSAAAAEAILVSCERSRCCHLPLQKTGNSKEERRRWRTVTSMTAVIHLPSPVVATSRKLQVQPAARAASSSVTPSSKQTTRRNQKFFFSFYKKIYYSTEFAVICTNKYYKILLKKKPDRRKSCCWYESWTWWLAVTRAIGQIVKSR